MRSISITSKVYGTHEVLVDDEDFDIINSRPWFLWRAENGNFYAKTRYIDPKKPRKRFPMHRVILGVTDPKTIIDHADRNSLNNQRCNLRIATHAQNACNSARVGKSGYKGVRIAPSGRYQVSIRIEGIKKYIGTYDTITEAAIKYNEAARRHHGEFAYQNPV